jgi:preprotein translocase subunit SecD
VKRYFSRIILIAIAIVLALVFLYPTYQDYQYRETLSSLSGQDSLRYAEDNQQDILDAKLNRLKLGLDLQGGMRVVLEVDLLKFLEDLAENKDENFEAIVEEVRQRTRLADEPILPLFAEEFQKRGIRMSRFYGNIRDDDETILARLEDETEMSIERAEQVVRNRVDQYGVSEPSIQKQGGRRIIVELPGVTNEAEVQQLLKGTARLEFKLARDPEISFRVMETIDNFLAGKLTPDSIETVQPSPSEEQPEEQDPLSQLLGGQISGEADTTEEARFSREHPLFAYVRIDQRTGDGYVEERDREWVRSILARAEVQALIPQDFEFMWSAKPITSEEQRFYLLHPVKRQPELTGGVIVGARASISQEDGRPIVNMEMNSEGSREWSRITGANIGKRIAISLDNAIFSIPYVQQKITGGRSQITGVDNEDEARLLEIVLKAGALPAPVTIMEERTVGPSLGEDSIRSGLSATALAFLFTVVFMVVYYRSAGLVADLALFLNVLFILGVLSGFQATLTLPGIAGIILTIGMAVDANVLIDERVREELDGGKTLRAAIDAGYSKALSAIVDSNITTFLTGIILYQFGTGPVQGFALTLMIGIAASLFSAVFVTRLVFNMLSDKGWTPKFG